MSDRPTVMKNDRWRTSGRRARLVRSFRILSREQCALALDAPTIARECAIVPHHAVAGYSHRDFVGGAGPGHGANRLGRADPCRDFAIARRRTGRDFPQGLPDALLECGAAHVEWEIETQRR